MVTVGGRYLKQRLRIYGSKLQHVSLPQTFKFPLVMQKLQHHHNQFHLYFYLLILSLLLKSENKIFQYPYLTMKDYFWASG